jgi:glycosyltransferase involved in cell wall biosynthesis
MTSQLNLVKVWCPIELKWTPHSSDYIECSCGYQNSEVDVSVITAVKDRIDEFIDSLKSLSNQSLLNGEPSRKVEHVIQDAGGDPNREKRIEAFSRVHTILSHEKDEGLYSAFNLGLRLSNGRYIAFLNSDDCYEKFFLFKSLERMESSGVDWTFGNIIIRFENGYSSYIPGKTTYYLKPWLNFSRFHHNTVLAKREMFKKIGEFPTEIDGRPIEFCADYYWFLSAQKANFVGGYIPSLIGYMNWGGVSAGSKLRIYSEAAFVASKVYPNKRTEITITWILRYLDNNFLTHKVFHQLRSYLRKIYSFLMIHRVNNKVEMGRVDERVH